MARYTRYKRESALAALAYGLMTDRVNRLGVSSDQVPMIDYDATVDSCRQLYTSFAVDLSQFYPIVEIRTERGYHIIVLTVLVPYRTLMGYLGDLKKEVKELRRYRARLTTDDVDAWIKAFEKVLKDSTDTFEGFYKWLQTRYADLLQNRCIDPLHVELSVVRGYTTLRISGKENKPYDIAVSALWVNGEKRFVTLDTIASAMAGLRIYRPDVDKILEQARQYIPENVYNRTVDTIRRFLFEVVLEWRSTV